LEASAESTAEPPIPPQEAETSAEVRAEPSLSADQAEGGAEEAAPAVAVAELRPDTQAGDSAAPAVDEERGKE